jgi:hypothetical protein
MTHPLTSTHHGNPDKAHSTTNTPSIDSPTTPAMRHITIDNLGPKRGFGPKIEMIFSGQIALTSELISINAKNKTLAGTLMSGFHSECTTIDSS